jgi:hypothetical protein
MHPSRIAGPRLLRGDKSSSIFELHAPKIVEMGKGIMNGQRASGSPFYLDRSERSQVDFVESQSTLFFPCLQLTRTSDRNSNGRVPGRTYSVCCSFWWGSVHVLVVP